MKPLLLIDVDGPLNPYEALLETRPPAGYSVHVVRPAGFEDGLTVLLNPEHGRALLELADAYDLVWATTWRADANVWIGPVLGLPELPWVDWPAPHGLSATGPMWKTRRVLEFADGRPFAWVDDELTRSDEEWVRARYDAATLLLPVDPATGLCRHHFEQLAAFARGLSRAS
jgi:hypothetical protein